ncbi:MAG: response regulator, partial [Gammaproteobacteria bacterium]|nr:response regulator [Gemmatimonadota bacterium]NIU73342.1 response regulator [Gammaproteobacteria bacterium]
VASTGEEAAELLGEHDVAAVLMDLRMPSMSGRTLFHLIKSQWPDLVPRVAVMSGDPESEDHEDWLSIHELSTIAKPFDLPAVVSLVAELVSGD